MINSHLAGFDEEVKPLGDLMTAATLEIYLKLASDLLPTPDKPHYLFNLRDISRVFQGVLQSQKEYTDSRDAMLRLWVHECSRSMVKVPSLAGQSAPSQPPHMEAFGPRLLHTLWRSHGATPLALGG